MNLRNLFIAITTAIMLSGCATVLEFSQNVATVALDKASTISNALALRDGYSDVKSAVVENADLFEPSELVELELHSAIIESFYSTVTGLAQSGNANEMLVNADEFLDAVLIVRSSVDRVIAIIEPKAALMGTEALVSTVNTFRNYRNLSSKLDVLLTKNDRKQAVLMAAQLMKSAIPVLQTLKVFK